MAGENKDGGAAGAMTLEQVAATLEQIGPQVAALTAAMAKLSAPAATPAAPLDGAAKDPAAAAPAATDPAAPKTPAATPDAALPAAMDAALAPLRATLATITTTIAAMDAAIKGMPSSLVADVSARDKLAQRLAVHVGTFDATDKTLAQVAAYGCEKLGLKPTAGAEFIAVDAFLTGAEKNKPAGIVRHGLDGATAPKANYVSRHLDAAATK